MFVAKCLTHKVPLKGDPFFIPGDTYFEWEIDMSNMYCPAVADDKVEDCDWRLEEVEKGGSKVS